MKIFFTALIVIFLSNITAKGQCKGEDIINLRKTALVFGEKDYMFARPLNNTINDVNSIADSLIKLGFDVTVCRNNNYVDMVSNIKSWYSKIPNYDVALLYYSGHGIEVNGENYLLPIDANPKSPSDLPHVAYSANDILASMESNNPKYNIIILDACRNNPLLKSWTRSIKEGLAPMSGAGNGSFIGYAAAPGTVASDGHGKNGPYTEAILKYIMTPNLSIYQIFTKVNYEVRAKTFGMQVPFINSSLSLDFCFSVTTDITSSSSARITSLQPASKVLLSSNGEKIFVSDSLNSKLLVKDSRTLGTINSPNYQNIHPYKIASGSNDNIYIIDTTANSLIVVDYKKQILKNSINLLYKPISFAISNNKNKAYVLSKKSPSDGNISVIDLSQNKVVKTIDMSIQAENIIISPVNDFIFIVSSCNNDRKGIYVFDNKLDDKPRVAEGIACGSAIGISPNGGKLYVSNIDADGINQVNILDAITLKVLGSVDFKAISFHFTSDKKYVLATGASEILLIRSDNDEVINKISLNTKIEGLALADDGRTFVSLPKENRIFVFSVFKHLVKDSLSNPEDNLRMFKEQMQKRNSIDPQFKINEVLTKLSEIIPQTIYNLKNELGINYEFYAPELMQPNLKENNLSFHVGIRAKSNFSKAIFPYIKARINDNMLIVTMFEEGSEDVYRSVVRNIDWGKAATFIRNYFSNRIRKLEI